MLSNVTTESSNRYPIDHKIFWGKTVLIMGDPSGISCATAAQLTNLGARVFFAAQSPAELSKAFALVDEEGGQWDGTVINVKKEEDFQHIFDLAVRRLGRIDFFITPYFSAYAEENETLVQEAIRHMGHGGRIIQIGQGGFTKNSQPGTDHGRSAALRREARTHGIHLTRIEPEHNLTCEQYPNKDVLSPSDVAKTIADSLAQSYEMDVVFLPGQFKSQIL